MDTVPRLFIESVCLRLLDHESLSESRSIHSRWGQVCTVTCEKIHTLLVFLDDTAGKIYAVALPALKCDTYSNYVPLDSVDLKFVTNFWITTSGSDKPNTWKEITLDDLKKLVCFIKSTRNERPPLRCDYKSLNNLTLIYERTKLLSMRFPVDSVSLAIDEELEEAEEFFKNAGPLYSVNYLQGPTSKPNTLDAIIDKFVPIDNGYFKVRQRFSKKQLTRLFEKCAISGKKVQIWVLPDDPTNSSDSVDFVDYDKYYSEKEVLEGGKTLLFSNGEEPNLKVRVERVNAGWLQWKWSGARRRP
uniref:F-box domain-containing protein n=1 Tax=Steinernema glaseri TaxID=37863 RepID=A0A1I7Y9L0_9BILA